LTCRGRDETDAIAKDTYYLMGYLEQYVDVAEFDISPVKYTLSAFQYTP